MKFALSQYHQKARSRIKSDQSELAPPRRDVGAGGFTIVEVILSAALFALITTGLVGILLYGEESIAVAGQRFQATALADESLAAARNMRDGNFNSLNDGVYGLAIQGNTWDFSGQNDVTGIFTRQVTVSTVSPERKKIVSTVMWQPNVRRTAQVNLTTYLTNWRRIVPPPAPPGGPGGGGGAGGPPPGRGGGRP